MMPVEPQDTIALQKRYLDQAVQFQLDADRHRHLASVATNPVDRREHEQAVISYEAQVAQMQAMAQGQQAILEAGHREAVAAREVERAAAAEAARVEAAEQQAQAARDLADAETERQRRADRVAEIERDLQEARERIERGRRSGRTPFD